MPLTNDSYTKLMLHCNGTDGGTTFTDDGVTGHTVTANGNANTATDQKQFGTASGKFDGTGDYLSIPDHDDFAYGTDPFTIDFWIRFAASGTFRIYHQFTTTTDDSVSLLFLLGSNLIQFEGLAAGSNTFDARVDFVEELNRWYHIAIVKYGATANPMLFFIDGIAQAITWSNAMEAAYSFPNFTSLVAIGANANNGGSSLNGWLDEFRISKGIARWQNRFNPPSSEYPLPQISRMALLDF